MKITILEDIGENGAWRWYSIYKYSEMTPKQAILNHIKEMGLDEKQGLKLTPEEGYYYASEDDIRAIMYKI